MSKSEWTTISLPKDLVAEIRLFNRNHPYYRSVSELVRDAVRRRMEELRELYKEYPELK